MLNISRQRVDKEIPTNELYSWRTLRPFRAGMLLARAFLAILIIFLISLFLPWQQNIRGNGKVTALNPQNRPQSIEAVIAGRIEKWHVMEGQFVKQGDTIISISEVKDKYFDPQLLLRLKEQMVAKEQGIVAKDAKVDALIRQVNALRNAMDLKIEQSKAKLEAEKVKFENAKNQFERNKTLYEAGNIALTKFQDVEYKYRGSEADFQNAATELDRVRAEYLDKISKAESDISNTRAELYDSQAELSKLTNEYANMQIRQRQYQILAPQTGRVVRAVKAGIGETIKEGDPVCTILPEAQDLAVEMYVKAMDVPLINVGRKVRIEFDGWPALQFSGWPSVSVGTFGGVVKVIDYINAKPGEFRILVVPDRADDIWPKQLRIGSGIKGWVMLDDVPVWYEMWRQLNGFPPSLYEEPLEEAIEDDKATTEKKK